MCNTTALVFDVTTALDRWHNLPEKVRAEIRLTLAALCRMSSHQGGVVIAAGEEAARSFGRKGFSAASLKRKYYAFRESGGDWRVLINGAVVKRDERAGLPPAFVEFWKSLCEENQRNCRAAYRKLCRLYMAGENIPGYGIKPPDVYDLPDGWSLSNLDRYKPTKFELTARRIGRSAAANFRPLVFTTRAGLEVGQYYVFDDLEHDVKVNLLGVNRVALRPLEFAALDLFSGCKFAWALKPMLIDDTDGSKQKLKEREFRFLLASVLMNTGYRPAGTTFLVEHGTAAISDELEQIIRRVTGGAVSVDRSGLEGAAPFAGMYLGRSKGNFRFKAALESHHSLVHSELAALPGQMGAGRDSAPEELHGRDRANERLIKAMAALPPERAALLRLPFLPHADFCAIVDLVYRQINNRTDHDLEGWEDARLVTNEFRLLDRGEWLPMARLLECSDEERLAVAAVIGRPGFVRQRKMSPWEVWTQGYGNLARVPAFAMPEIMGMDNGVPRKIEESHLVEFEDRELGPGTHRYLSTVMTPEGRAETLRPGETYLVHVNPLDSRFAFFSHAGTKRGAFIGIAARWEKVCRADTEALHRQMGAAAKIEAELLAPLAKRGAAITQRRIEDARHNAAVLAGEPVTQGEKLHASETNKRLRRENGTIDDLMGGDPAPAVMAGADVDDDLRAMDSLI